MNLHPGTEISTFWLLRLAARTGLTVRALRVYEREGLLRPSRAANGWRRYGPNDLMRLNTISQSGRLASLLYALQMQAIETPAGF